MRYIDADALIKKMFPLGMGDGMYVINAKAVKFAIDKTPTADVVPNIEYDAVVSAVDNSTKEFLKLHDDYQAQNGEIERLRKALDEYEETSGLKQAKAEVVDEFAKRLKEKMNDLSRLEYDCVPYFLVSKSFINKIAEEMKGD